MVLGTEVHELSCDVPQTLSPEQIARATLKNSELDQSLGISPTQHLHEDPNPDEGLYERPKPGSCQAEYANKYVRHR